MAKKKATAKKQKVAGKTRANSGGSPGAKAKANVKTKAEVGANEAGKAATERPPVTPAQTGGVTVPKAEIEVVTTLSHDDIAARAYAIWLRKGRPLGQDAANWAEAVAELKG